MISLFSAPLAGQEVTLRAADAIAEGRFTRIVDVRELSDGSVLLVDRSENRLVHVDWTGEAEDIGRVGAGPGEYRTAGGLYSLRGDSTLFMDARTSRWNLLHGPRIVATLSEHRPLNRLLGDLLSGADRHGHVLGVTGYLFSGRRRQAHAADSLLLLIADWRTEGVDTVTRLKGAGQAGFTRLPGRNGRPQVIVGGNPLDADEQALLFPDGWIAVARLGPYRVDWRRPDGRWTRGEPLPFERIEVTDAERCAAMAGYLPQGPRCDPDLLPGWPEELPPFLRTLVVPMLFEAPGGRLVITRTRTAGARERRYDIVDRRGRLDGVLVLPADEYLIGFGPGSAYTVSTDSLGLQHLRRHPWP